MKCKRKEKLNELIKEIRKSGFHNKNMHIPGVTFILPVSIDSSWVIIVADKACSIKCGDILTQDDSKTKIEMWATKFLLELRTTSNFPQEAV